MAERHRHRPSFSPLWGIRPRKIADGRWTLNVVNSGAIASAFVPLEVIPELEGQKISFLSFRIRNPEPDTPIAGVLINPGESVDFDLYIELENVFEGTEWSTLEGGSPKIDLTVRYLNLGDMSRGLIDLPLPD